MALLAVPVVSTDLLLWHKKDRTFSAEWSELRGVRLQPIYDDAADLGFAVCSAKTGRVVRLVLQCTKRDREGDMQYQIFIPAESKDRHLFKHLIVFND